MKPTAVDIAYLYEAFCELTEGLSEACEAADSGVSETESEQLIQAMSQLAGVMREIEQGIDAPLSQHRDIHTLCEYGLQLLDELRTISEQLGLSEQAQGLENLSLPTAVWAARQGSEIRLLAPVVNALTFYANHASEPDFMAQLLGLSDEVYEATSPSLIDAFDPNDAMHPWRRLLLNRAIIATRTLQPALMEPAFDAVVEHLQHEALAFFEEGLSQMEVNDYPTPVRKTLEQYYLRLRTPHTLH